MNQNTITQAIIREIVAHTRCAVCGHHFGMGDVRVIGRREKVWAMSVSCRECRTQALLLAVMSDGAARSIHTDLTPEEWTRFRELAPISTDDVIVFHQQMRAYDGDFSEILDEPLPAD